MFFKDVKISTIAAANKDCPRQSEAGAVRCNDGSLFIAWQHYFNSNEGANDGAPSSLYCARSYDNGDTWVEEKELIKTPKGAINVYSPNFINLKDGSIGFIYFIWNSYTNNKKMATVKFLVSKDDCKTFTEQCTICNDAINFSNDCIRRLSNGRILLPCYQNDENAHISVLTLFSDDEGKTWQKSKNTVNLPMRGAMEPFVAEAADGQLVMVVRTQLGSPFRATSDDMGETWSLPQTTGLSAPESCPFLISVPNSNAMIFGWNNAPYNPGWASHYGKRTPFTLAVTYDKAKTFNDFINIETDPGIAFSNPGGMWLSDDELLMTYWIEPYDEKWLMTGPMDVRQAKIKIDRSKLQY